ncbi:MAG: hypothetical protein ACRD1B_05870, partial [Thermoanaerobaculia bacterium]
TGVRYAKARTLNVLYPGTTTNAGPTTTWFYEPRGSRATPTIYQIDTSLETTFTVWRTVELGLKGEAFNVTNQQKATNVNNTTWCDDTSATASASCVTARNTFGTTTSRGSYQTPRGYRLTALLRF